MYEKTKILNGLEVEDEEITCSISPFCLAEAMKDLAPTLPAMLMNWDHNDTPIPNTTLRGIFLHRKALLLIKILDFCVFEEHGTELVVVIGAENG